MRWPTTLSVLLLLLLLLLLCRAASATPTPEQRKLARASYERAVAHYNLEEFPQAAEAFRETYRIIPDSSVLYNIAQTYRFAGDGPQALRFYETFLREEPTTPVRAEVEQRIKDLKEHASDPPSLKPPVARSTPDGGIPPAARTGSDRLAPVVAMIKARRAGFRACFDAWSAKHPKVALKVPMLLFLDPDGLVARAEADPAGVEALDLAGCIAKEAHAITFPKSPSGKFTRVMYPFDFKPR